MSPLTRHPMLLRKGFRDLRRSPAQTVALALIALLGVSSLVALVGAYRDLGGSYSHVYQQTHFADVTFSLGGAPTAVLDRVRAVDGVRAVSGRLIVDSGLALPAGDSGGSTLIRARLIGLPAEQRPAVDDLLVEQGRYVTPADDSAVLLESHFASAYHLAPGAKVAPLLGGAPVELRAVGVAASPEYLIVSAGRQDVVPSARSFAVLFVPLPELQRLSGATGQINDVAVLLAPGADQARVVAAIQQVLAPYQLRTTTLRADQPSNAALHLDLAGYQEIAVLMPGIILLVAAASLYVMLGRQIRAQEAQIGLMKALGYDNGSIERHYLAGALGVTLVGALLGVAAGVFLGRALTGAYANQLGIPLVRTRLYPDILVLGIALSLLSALLGSWGPTRQIARLAPAAAMRPNPAGVGGAAVARLRWIGRLPLWLRLAVRNVLRVRRRSLTTVLGMVFAFTLVLMGWAMIDSMSTVLNRHFHTVERWDQLALFAAPQDGAALARLRTLSGVRQVEPFLQLPATVAAGDKRQQQQIQLMAIPPGSTLHDLRLSLGASVTSALAPGHIVLNGALAGSLGVRPGDTVTVDGALGQRRLVVGGLTDELMSDVAYLSLSDARGWLGKSDAFNGVYLTTDPGSGEQAQVQRALYGQGAASVQAKAAIERDWRSLFGLFYVLMGAVLAFAVAMAFALLFTTATANVLERGRELATMRALGAGRGTIALLLSAESLLLWLLALLPGLLLGSWVAARLGASFQSDIFAFHVAAGPRSDALTAVAVLATMLLAALPAIRHVNRLDLAEATKVLS